MESENGKNRSSQVWERHKRGQPESESRSVGSLSGVGGKHESYQVRVGRENSYKTDTLVPREQSGEGITGKIIGQLVGETEKQLAYHEQQVELLKRRLEELKQFSEITDNSDGK